MIGATQQGLIWLLIACGIVRLALIWFGLEWYLQRRWERGAALALAAALPASVQLDGMFSNELMRCMFGVAAMLLWLRALWPILSAVFLALGAVAQNYMDSQRRPRWRSKRRSTSAPAKRSSAPASASMA